MLLGLITVALSKLGSSKANTSWRKHMEVQEARQHMNMQFTSYKNMYNELSFI